MAEKETKKVIIRGHCLEIQDFDIPDGIEVEFRDLSYDEHPEEYTHVDVDGNPCNVWTCHSYDSQDLPDIREMTPEEREEYS